MHLPKVMNDAFSCVKAHAQNCKTAASNYAGRLWEAMPNSCRQLAQKVNQCLLPQLDKLKSLFSRYRKEPSPQASSSGPRLEEEEISETEGARAFQELEIARGIWRTLTGEELHEIYQSLSFSEDISRRFPLTPAAQKALQPTGEVEEGRLLTPTTIEAFRSNRILTEGCLKKAFVGRLHLYGFTLQESLVSWREDIPRERRKAILDSWSYEGTPHFTQIARMLWSLQLLDCQREASAFKEWLNQLASEERIAVPQRFLRLWNSPPPST